MTSGTARTFLAGVLASAFVIGLIIAFSTGAIPGFGPSMAGADGVEPFGFRVGELVPNVSFTDIDGTERALEDFRGAAATVIAVRDTGCPVSGRYAPRLARLEARYASEGVRFLYLNPGPQESMDAMRADVEDFGFAGPYVHDREGDMARALRVRSTGEVLVLDPSLSLIYRGGVDDQYGITYTRPEVTAPWLERAIDAVLAGTVPAERFIDDVPGCVLGFDRDDEVAKVASRWAPEEGLTYHNRISRVLQENCVACHREGGIGPFSLADYDQVFGYRYMLEYVVEERIMPPWFASPETGHWANDRSMREEDRRALLSWIASGAPEGDPSTSVSARSHAPGWNIGEPDAVFRLPEPQEIPAEGTVPYRYVYVQTDFPEDRWVRKVEIRPTAPEVTHHVIVFNEPPGALPPGQAEPGDPIFQGGIDGFFAATAPGSVGVEFGEGKAKKLPAGAWLKFQLHYTANGRATTDQTSIGFVFADEPPVYEVETASAYNTRFSIPPGAERHEVVGEFTFPEDGRVERLFPHTHVRGVAFRYELVRPDGSEEMILDLPRYDFDWQLTYDFAQPLRVEAGSILRATAWYDNSENNPFNPDPTAEVRFGEQTWEEMMIGYFDWVREGGRVVADN